MSNILKTKALIIRKNEFGDSSYILNIFSEENGKFPIIIKGARSSKNKKVLSADLLNYVNIVIYKKENRETQLATQVDLINGYGNLKNDLDGVKYAFAICELLNNLLLDNEPHARLFKGVLRILDLMELNKNYHKYFFVKFLIFFIEEIGFKINLESCALCGVSLINQPQVGINYDKGFLCNDCSSKNIIQKSFDSELFNLLLCLSTKKNEVKFSDSALNVLINFLESYLCFHVQEFKGIQSFKMY